MSKILGGAAKSPVQKISSIRVNIDFGCVKEAGELMYR